MGQKYYSTIYNNNNDEDNENLYSAIQLKLRYAVCNNTLHSDREWKRKENQTYSQC